jgi:hypothetical protein
MFLKMILSGGTVTSLPSTEIYYVRSLIDIIFSISNQDTFVFIDIIVYSLSCSFDFFTFTDFITITKYYTVLVCTNLCASTCTTFTNFLGGVPLS